MAKKKKKTKKQDVYVVHRGIEVKEKTIPFALRYAMQVQKDARVKSQIESTKPIKKARISPEVKTTSNGMELKTVSSIRQMGYTITLPREKRWEILKNIVIPKVGKDEAIKHIKFLITMNQGQSNKISAVYEWKYDLNRLMKNKISKVKAKNNR